MQTLSNSDHCNNPKTHGNPKTHQIRGLIIKLGFDPSQNPKLNENHQVGHFKKKWIS